MEETFKALNTEEVETCDQNNNGAAERKYVRYLSEQQEAEGAGVYDPEKIKRHNKA